jgi:hypothetical protein
LGWHIIEKHPRTFKTPVASPPPFPSFAPAFQMAYTKSKGLIQSVSREGNMARLTRIEKFKRKIDIDLDHIRASLIELRAKAKEVKLDTRVSIENTLDAIEKGQGDIKSKLDDWVKAGVNAAGDLKKSIKHSTKDLRKSVKKAYKSLT